MATLEIMWKVVAQVEDGIPAPNSPLFTASENRRLYAQFGDPPPVGIRATSLRTTLVFHQAMQRLGRVQDVDLPRALQFPYLIHVDGYGRAKLTCRVRWYETGVAAVSIVLGPFEIGEALDPDEVIRLQVIRRMPAAELLARGTIGMLQTGRFRNPVYPRLGPVTPMVRLRDVSNRAAFSDWKATHKSQMVAVLIRNWDWKTSEPILERRVWRKNQDLNIKSSSELILADRQGMLLATPTDHAGGYDDHYPTWRFRRVADLFEIALVCRRILDSHDSSGPLVSHLQGLYRWIRQPDQVLYRSVGHATLWKHLCSELQLEAELDDRAPAPDIVLGDKFQINQAGAVGPGATVGRVTQVNVGSIGLVDVDELRRELAIVRTAFADHLDEPEAALELAHLANAELALKDGDTDGALSHLARLGNWARDVAVDVGAALVAKVIEAHM